MCRVQGCFIVLWDNLHAYFDVINNLCDSEGVVFVVSHKLILGEADKYEVEPQFHPDWEAGS